MQQSDFISSRYKWIALAVCYLLQVTFVYVIQSLPPLLNMIGEEFTASKIELGLLFSIYSISGVFIALPIGQLINRYGFYMLGIISAIMIAISSLIVAMAQVFIVVIIGRFILGVGGVIMTIGLPVVISQLFSGKDVGKAMGIFSTTFACGTIITFPIVTILALNFDWRFPFYLGTILLSISVVLFMITIKRDLNRINITKENQIPKISQILGNINIWKFGIIFLFYTATISAFLSWAPTLFQDFRHIDILFASLLASVFNYANLVSMPIFGYVSDRFGRRKVLLMLGQLLTAIAFISIVYVPQDLLILSVLFLGIVASVSMPLIYAVAAESLPPNLAGTGFSIITLCQNLGITVSAIWVGYIFEVAESILFVSLGISFFAIAGALMTLTIKGK